VLGRWLTTQIVFGPRLPISIYVLIQLRRYIESTTNSRQDTRKSNENIYSSWCCLYMFSYLDEPAYSCGAVYFQGIKGLLCVMKSLPVTGFMSAEITSS
jgi:hypothetical protein